MKRLLSAVVALVSAALLSSCALLPFAPGSLFRSDEQQADARMEKIAAAVNSHDSAALKAMFSTRALENATEIDERLDILLSSFPNGGLTWERDVVPSEGSYDHFQRTQLLEAYYKASADGKDYVLFFADFTVNDNLDPDNVGIYALGITPWFEGHQGFGPAQSFSIWAGAMTVEADSEDGYPGVYAGYDNSQTSIHRLDGIVREVNSHDTQWLDESFTAYARAERAPEIKAGITKLFALFPDGDVVWQKDQQAAPVVREKTSADGKTLLLLSTYRVTSKGSDYWLFCADFRENATDPDNLGVYAIGLAPRTATGDSPAEQALFAWAATFDIDTTTPPGILIP